MECKPQVQASAWTSILSILYELQKRAKLLFIDDRVSNLRRGHANLLCIVPILVYVLPKQECSRRGLVSNVSSY